MKTTINGIQVECSVEEFRTLTQTNTQKRESTEAPIIKRPVGRPRLSQTKPVQETHRQAMTATHRWEVNEFKTIQTMCNRKEIGYREYVADLVNQNNTSQILTKKYPIRKDVVGLHRRLLRTSGIIQWKMFKYEHAEKASNKLAQKAIAEASRLRKQGDTRQYRELMKEGWKIVKAQKNA